MHAHHRGASTRSGLESRSSSNVSDPIVLDDHNIDRYMDTS